MAISATPDCLHAASTLATWASGMLPSPRTKTPSRGYSARAWSQPGAQLGQRDLLAIEHDHAVVIDVDDPLLGGRGQGAGGVDLGNFQLDLPLGLDEFGADHEENDQQEQDVDQRRQVQHRHLFELAGFQGHRCRHRAGSLRHRSIKPAAERLFDAGGLGVLQSFGRNRRHDLLPQARRYRPAADRPG